MLEIASEIVICLLLAALIGFALGYLVAKRQSEKSKPATNPEENTKTKTKDTIIEEPVTQSDKEVLATQEIEIPTEKVIEEAQVGTKPELLSAPRDGEKDNLAKIKGIGPKLEVKFNAAGIYHFEQIANWTEDNMLWLEKHTIFTTRSKNEAWIMESKALLS